MSRATCLGSKMSTYSTCCRRSTTIPKSPLARNLFPPNQNVKMFQISKRKPCCCCCKWVKLGGAEDQRLQFCVFLALLIGIRDGVNFCTVEYFHLYFFSEQNFACICPFTLCCNGVCDHSNPIYIYIYIYIRLSLFLRFICPPTDSTPSSLRSTQDISRDLDQRISASLQSDSARAILKRIHLTASRDTPSHPLLDNL